MIIRKDPYNAFLDYGELPVAAAEAGPLQDLSFAVKDIFDVAGYPTGCGNPIKLAESPLHTESCPVVQRMLDAGAEFVGKTQTDEMAFSLTGLNKHFPRPLNPRDPDRITGGSSAGSAAATAAGLCDFAIGSDTGGSVRAPGSFCGLWGIRPTHGRVPLEKVMPMAASFDVPGYFADRADVFKKVAEPFLGPDVKPFRFARVLRAEECFDRLADEIADAMTQAVAPILSSLGPAKSVRAAPYPLEEGYEAFRHLQAAEAWEAHGEWITSRDPDMTPGVRERFEFGVTVTGEMRAAANVVRDQLREHAENLLGDDGLLMLPTVPTVAPRADMSQAELLEFREQTLPFLCISGLTKLPQVTLPLASRGGIPIGIGLIGPSGCDMALIDFACTLQLQKAN